LQSFLLQVEVSQIAVREADEPNALVDFFDSEPLACQDAREVDLLAVQADASAGCDKDIAVVERMRLLSKEGFAASMCNSIQRIGIC
jgi:hypothetical protein